MTEERTNNEKENLTEKKKGAVLWEILLLLLILFSGVFASAFLCFLNDRRFDFYLWPVIACIDVFVFTTIGFFQTEGKKEIAYGICSVISAACTILQMAIFF